MNYLEESYLEKKVFEFMEKKELPNGTEIPGFVTYRTVYEFEALKQLGVCKMTDFNSVRMKAVQFSYFSISCLRADEHDFVCRNYANLIEFYGIKQ